MSKLKYFSDLSNLSDPQEFMQRASPLLSNIESVINGNLEFDLNMKTQTVSVVFPSANSDLIVSHGLNKTGVKYWVVGKTAACDIYHGNNSDTTGTIHLKSTVGNVTVTLILF